MHIPDGYLSPKTCAVFYAVMLPVWYVAARRVEKTLRLRELPLLSLGAAFTFVIMMFNIPIPGGSSGHMVGSVVVAIVLGPWAGVVGLSLAVTLQAFLFGDGGVTAIGANSFNMALVMSFSGYFVYKVVAIGNPGPSRRWAAAALAAFIAVNLAALAAAFELGLQPIIASTPEGRPMYSPYPLSISIPAMMAPHLLFFGPVEAIGTALAVSYMHRTGGELLKAEEGRGLRPLWIVLFILIVITPLGLMATGTPWGEWGKEEFIDLIGYVPAGMDALGDRWKGVLPDYGMPGAEGALSKLAYILSALVGSIVIVLAVFVWGKLWRR